MTKLQSDHKQAIQSARRFIRAVEKSGVHLDAAYVYGSYILGTARADSDIDIALVSSDFTGRLAGFEKIKPTLRAMDSRIEHVRYHPKNFRDENPLAWEIKATGIQLVGKQEKKRNHSLNVSTIVAYWVKTADFHWHTAQTMFEVRDYPRALEFGQRYIEEMLKAAVVRSTRAHSPFRRKLTEFADIIALSLTQAQREFLERLDEYGREPRDFEGELARNEKYTREFCKSELKHIREFGKLLASSLKRKRIKRG